MTSNFGVSPKAIVLSDDSVAIGHDDRLTVVDTRTLQVRYDESLEGPFYDFEGPFDQCHLAICEIGVVKFDTAGIVWRRQTPLIKEWSLADGELKLTLFDDDTELTLRP